MPKHTVKERAKRKAEAKILKVKPKRVPKVKEKKSK